MLRSLFRRPQPSPDLEHFAWLLGREPQPDDLRLTLAESAGEQTDDGALVARVAQAYRAAFAEFAPTGGGWDKEFFQLKRSIHDALMAGGGAAAKVLRNPADNAHFWGFDAIARAPAGTVEPHELVLSRLNRSVSWRRLYALWTFDALKNLAEAVGAKRVAHPEVDVANDPVEQRQGIEQTLQAIEAAVGLALAFPNPYRGELGLPTSRGIVGFRAVQAIYQAWKVRELARGRPDFRVLEIGAGLGRTAYFASCFGITNYTVVDIPLTNAAQGYFLGRSVGEALKLHTEAEGALRVVPTTSAALQEQYDLVLNVDSLTEMDPTVAAGYWKFIQANARQFLSINHEYNPSTVRSLYAGTTGAVSRHPYWMRRGYVEELVRFE